MIQSDIRVESRISKLLELQQKIRYLDDKNSKDLMNKMAISFFEKSLTDKILKNYQDSKYEFLDLFAGAGGLSLGLEESGFTPVTVVDNDKSANQTYWFNRPFLKESAIFSEDIKSVDVEKFTHTPLVVGGPPCQGFSSANKQRKKNDDRNELYKFFIKSIQSVKPKIFLMENVEGILTYKDIIQADFQAINYTTKVFRFNTKELGLPQQRKRVFFLGIDNDISSLHEELFSLFNLDDYVITDSFTLESAIGDLPILQAKTLRNSTNIDSDSWGYIIGSVHTNNTQYSKILNGASNFQRSESTRLNSSHWE